MSDATAAAPHGHGDAHGQSHYIKIWGILLGLLVVSVIGPMIGIPVLTLITAFGIAVVKAYLVIKHFMHLTVEKKYIGFLLITMLAFMLVFIGGVSPDVMKHEGQRWSNDAAKAVVEKGLKEEGKAGGHGGDAHPAAPAEGAPKAEAAPAAAPTEAPAAEGAPAAAPH